VELLNIYNSPIMWTCSTYIISKPYNRQHFNCTITVLYMYIHVHIHVHIHVLHEWCIIMQVNLSDLPQATCDTELFSILIRVGKSLLVIDPTPNWP